MFDYYSYLRPLLFGLPAETAHHAAITALRMRLVPSQKPYMHPALASDVFGLHFANPFGLAAGFDKNGAVYNALFAQGFGFVEIGTVTPKPQPGNPRPRLFRLKEDEAVINRFGFNSAGVGAMMAHLARQGTPKGVLGINIGKNKTTEDFVSDYALLYKACAKHASYITVNISSPNTQGLRDLQAQKPLEELLSALSTLRQETTHKPLLLKIAPDLTEGECEVIAGLCLRYGMDGIIVSNTTIARPDSLKSHYAPQQGGLSGAPLFERSTEILRLMYRLTQGKIPLVGVGGISTAEQAYAKIKAGASLLQLYSALVYQGFALIPVLQKGLVSCLGRDGLKHISEAIGKD